MDTQARNRLWLSRDQQDLIAKKKIFMLGAGGNGALFSVFAASVGFQNIVVSDHDVLDETNLNRYFPARRDDVGRYKVEILEKFFGSRFPHISFLGLRERFPSEHLLEEIHRSDLVVSCVDSVEARISLDIYCRLKERLLIDLGSGFVKDDTLAEGSETGQVIAAGCQVLVSRSKETCLRCLGFDLEAASNTYFIDSDIPEPSSILLNSMVTTLALEIIILELSNELLPINRISFDRETLGIIRSAVSPTEGCSICEVDDAIVSVGQVSRFKNFLSSQGIRTVDAVNSAPRA